MIKNLQDRFFVLITGAQPKAGTGHKMQSIPVIFSGYIVRDISLTYFGSARWLIEILSAILKSATQLLVERPLRCTSL